MIWVSRHAAGGRRRTCRKAQVDPTSEEYLRRRTERRVRPWGRLPVALGRRESETNLGASRGRRSWGAQGTLRRVSPACPGGRRRSGAGTGGPRHRRGGECGTAADAGAAWERSERGSAQARVTSTASARVLGLARARGARSGTAGARADGAPRARLACYSAPVRPADQITCVTPQPPRHKPSSAGHGRTSRRGQVHAGRGLKALQLDGEVREVRCRRWERSHRARERRDAEARRQRQHRRYHHANRMERSRRSAGAPGRRSRPDCDKPTHWTAHTRPASQQRPLQQSC